MSWLMAGRYVADNLMTFDVLRLTDVGIRRLSGFGECLLASVWADTILLRLQRSVNNEHVALLRFRNHSPAAAL